MRWVADLSNWDTSLNNVVVGASGHVLSGHFRDQWKAYWAGTSFPLPFAKVEAKNTLELVP
jgi:penicillin amidase